ncbi:pyridoxal phosphate-dependent decarboxylase family protein [Dethiobacter alkaliphilus]|uniref:Aromatic-L-amino-acid decarboxylase n=1 Tax=Dethiobacter alkaliphilus AHT 1 TaxID=555088 RepID=C0GK43_DETAL|nr:aminotransferase class V-fold PLP-dependent enzyme [Dethiobacter alkaliphilus]EEG76313.1 Aromatic-L-amino-acid decarboxylase [Dethiobacter alkaliphilus AHT 1]
MDTEQFRKYGYEFVDWIADYMEKVEQLPVRSEVLPGEIKKQLPHAPPQQGEPMAQIFSDFQQIIMPGITHWQHPCWFAYFPANNSPASVLAEMLTAGMGAQAMVWQTSPAATELEEVVMEWLRQMLGLPEEMEGVIQDTASTSTLCALLTARETATGFMANEEGMRQPLVVYASTEGHSSIDKAVKIAGYGKKNLRHIPTDENYAMIPEKLEEAIKNDVAAGLIPACVVASVGTTSSTAVDPVRKIGEICRRHNVWLHVDAAFSGTAAIAEENRWMLDGAEYIDSFVFNPHKWMLTNFDCSAYFVRDTEKLIRTFEIHPEYLKTGADKEVKNFRDWGIQLGRRFRALKLWFVIRSYGVEGIRQMVNEHLRLARLFKEWIEEEKHFEVLAPVHVSLVVFRLNNGAAEDELDSLNRLLLEKVNATGEVFLTHTSLGGRYAIRMAIGQRTTQEHHVREAWDIIRAKAAETL